MIHRCVRSALRRALCRASFFRENNLIAYPVNGIFRLFLSSFANVTQSETRKNSGIGKFTFSFIVIFFHCGPRHKWSTSLQVSTEEQWQKYFLFMYILFRLFFRKFSSWFAGKKTEKNLSEYRNEIVTKIHLLKIDWSVCELMLVTRPV